MATSDSRIPGQGEGQVAGYIIALPTSQGRIPDAELDRAVEENRPLRELSHPNLAKVIDIIALHQEVQLVVQREFIEGITLEQLISVGGALSEELIRRYSKQICSAMEYLHSQKVLHRNINSKTVMITNTDNHVKLIDYGLSIQLLDACSFQVSATARGLPQYMAPEMLEVTESSPKILEVTESSPEILEVPESLPQAVYSRGSDIWAFGCLVYEMATGKKPHVDCKNINALTNRILNGPPPELPDHCSETLKSFYKSCMAKDRKERKRAAELLEHDFLVNG